MTHEDVRRALTAVKDPELQRSIVELGMVRDIVADDRARRRHHRPHDRGLPAAQPDPRGRGAGSCGDRRRPHRRGEARRHVVRRAGRAGGAPQRPPRAHADASSAPARRRAPSPIASGKGGVGKSTVTVEPRRRAGRPGARRRAHRRRCLRAHHPADDGAAGRASGDARGQDDPARGPWREGRLHGLLPARQRARGLARAHAGPRHRAVPRRRPLGQPRLPAHRPPARDRRHRPHGRADDPRRRA